MRRRRRLLRVVGILLLAAVVLFTVGVLVPSPELPAHAPSSFALTGVTVVDTDSGRVAGGRTVVVHGGRIALVGADGAAVVPPGVPRIDATGKFVMPALWDMHVHLTAISPLLDLPLHVRFGVTNVRDMLGCPRAGDPFIACPEDQRRWTDEATTGRRIAPRSIVRTSFLANGPSVLGRVQGVPPFFGTANADDARAFVRHFAGRVDAIKVYDRLPRDAYFALVDEARRAGLDVVGHRPHGVSALEAIRHQRSIEHARFLLHESWPGRDALRAAAGTAAWREDRAGMVAGHDPAMAAELLAAMAAAGTWYVPTHLTRWADAFADADAVRADSLLVYLHPLVRWQWLEDIDATVASDPTPAGRAAYRAFHRKGLELTRRADSAGVRLLVGTDYVTPGADVHRELALLVEAGLSPARALRAATLAPAQYAGREGEMGRVREGFVADLIVLDANPLTDIANTARIDAVVFGGALYDRAALARIDAHVRRQARSWTVACKILWRFLRQPANY